MKQIKIYADGSSLGNPGPGGFCAILEYKNHKKIISGGEQHTTNNRMELKAAIEGIRLLKEPCEVVLISDSSYVVNAINGWLAGWVKKDFKNVKNPDLWREYLSVAASHKIKGEWVKGHAGHPQNEECDKIAKMEAEKYR